MQCGKLKWEILSDWVLFMDSWRFGTFVGGDGTDGWRINSSVEGMTLYFVTYYEKPYITITTETRCGTAHARWMRYVRNYMRHASSGS